MSVFFWCLWLRPDVCRVGSVSNDLPQFLSSVMSQLCSFNLSHTLSNLQSQKHVCVFLMPLVEVCCLQSRFCA